MNTLTNDPPVELYSYWRYCMYCKRYTYQRSCTGGFTCGECYQTNGYNNFKRDTFKMTLPEDIIVNHKGLIMHFVKGSIVENRGKATYILPPKKTKSIEEKAIIKTFKNINTDVLTENEDINTEK